MPDKITGTGFRPVETTGARRPDARAGGTEASDTTAVGSKDTVHLTASALLMGKLEEKLVSIPVVDANRVAALQGAIASGHYAVDVDTVADRMIRSERELGA